ncbi:MAG: DNA/RNA nuclease SfsA [Desulfobulbaceae bacterium]|uniref:Sugar fermentation stimulation protein homolog n=1 Tax=Candidatus Desulfobia pelagia TaxID=2841692 RepID=A0A8J6TFW3_9BACT|nr:DNA/RNA nuclease SfsA [Candidatus Desulfobia pelagia]
MILPLLEPALFVKRYKRFLVDVEMADGSILTVHCPNTGSMRGCLSPKSPVMLSRSDSPTRKYPHTLEMIQVDGNWVGINTSRTNHLVREAIENGIIHEFGKVGDIKAEVKVSGKSRLDFLLQRVDNQLYVEVKNCTLVENGTAMFPDAVTERGTKHLRELIDLKGQGFDAAVFFCVQRMDGQEFAPAAHIDPLYAATLAEAAAAGVMVVAYQATVGPEEIKITHALPVRL